MVGWCVLVCGLVLSLCAPGPVHASFRLAVGFSNTFGLDLRPVPSRLSLATSNVFGLQGRPPVSRLGAAVSNLFGFAVAPPLGPVDVSDQVQVTYRGLFVDPRRLLAKVNFRVENISSQSLAGPLLVVVTAISNASVQITNADGTTPEGLPFFELSAQMPSGLLAADEVTLYRTIAFDNPTNARFGLTTKVLQGLFGPKLAVQQEAVAFDLAQNKPNPFNPQTVIGYRLAVAGPVSLVVYNILGQPVRGLVATVQEVGGHRVVWNGRDDNGQTLGNGIYIYRLMTEQGALSRRMVLLR